MELSITKPYMKIGIGYEMTCKKISFFHDEKQVLEMDVRLEIRDPDAFVYLDMSRFLGMRLRVACEPDLAFRCEFVDAPDGRMLYTEKYRPAAHFSAARGWINDPNGLFYCNGLYHMFFQHNPVDRQWGNMHWGHAVSEDLVHWTQWPEALYPDELGPVFSGSAIIDSRNASGLKQGDQDPILVFYTAGGGCSSLSSGRKFTQCMAYSTDAGRTFVKYEGNPLIENIVGENRDPKVVFNPQEDLYYMALFLEGNRFALFFSSNLLDWKQTQEIILPEDAECPDLYPIPLEGRNAVYWVFSGASDRYLVGTIGGGYFKQLQSVRRLHYGNSHYAAQTFSGVPAADGRTLRIAWNRAPIPNAYFNGAMCTPAELTLRRIDGSLMLCAAPVRELETLYDDKRSYKSVVVDPRGRFRCELVGKAHDLTLVLEGGSERFTVSLLGLDIFVDPGLNRLECGSGTMPLYMRDGKIALRMITDTSAVEIYADQGEAHYCAAHIADYNLNWLTLTAGDKPLRICQLEVVNLNSIWSQPTTGKEQSHT